MTKIKEDYMKDVVGDERAPQQIELFFIAFLVRNRKQIAMSQIIYFADLSKC